MNAIKPNACSVLLNLASRFHFSYTTQMIVKVKTSEILLLPTLPLDGYTLICYEQFRTIIIFVSKIRFYKIFNLSVEDKFFSMEIIKL